MLRCWPLLILLWSTGTKARRVLRRGIMMAMETKMSSLEVQSYLSIGKIQKDKQKKIIEQVMYLSMQSIIPYLKKKDKEWLQVK